MACMVFDMPETLIAPFKAKKKGLGGFAGGLSGKPKLLGHSPLMHTEGTAPLVLETVGHLWTK